MRPLKHFLLTVLLAVISNSCAKDLECKDFKNGEFTLSILSDPDNVWDVVRKGNKQVESIMILPADLQYGKKTEYSIALNIEWIDDCNYRLFADDSVIKFNPSYKSINDSGGVLTELLKIEGNCFYYVSTSKFDGKEVILEGKLCKKVNP